MFVNFHKFIQCHTFVICVQTDGQTIFNIRSARLRPRLIVCLVSVVRPLVLKI